MGVVWAAGVLIARSISLMMILQRVVSAKVEGLFFVFMVRAGLEELELAFVIGCVGSCKKKEQCRGFVSQKAWCEICSLRFVRVIGLPDCRG